MIPGIFQSPDTSSAGGPLAGNPELLRRILQDRNYVMQVRVYESGRIVLDMRFSVKSFSLPLSQPMQFICYTPGRRRKRRTRYRSCCSYLMTARTSTLRCRGTSGVFIRVPFGQYLHNYHYNHALIPPVSRAFLVVWLTHCVFQLVGPR